MGRKRSRKRSFKNYIIACLFMAVVLMTVGYAVYGTDLVINGVGKIISDWDLRFTSAVLNEATTGAIEVTNPVISEDGLELDVSVAMSYTNDYIVYDVDITNFSKMFSAEYTGIEIKYADSNPFISWRISGITVGDIIGRDEIAPITLTAYWNPAKVNMVPSDATSDLDTTHTENVTLKLTFKASTESSSLTPEKDPPLALFEYSTQTWTKDSVIAKITFDQENITILNNGGSDEYTFEENGSFTFEYKYDAFKTASETVTVNWIDKTAPVISVINNPKEDTWTKQSLTITPSASDVGSGFAKYLWNINDGAWNEVWIGTFDEDINAKVGIIAVDNVGNQSDAKYTNVKVDKTPPVITMIGSSSITIGVGDDYNDPGVNVNDNFSTGLTATSTSTINPSVEGTYYVYYNVSDLAGNAAAQVRRTVYVTSNMNLQRYDAEMSDIEALILSIEENNKPRIGTALTSETAIGIRGINYYDRWYRITAADILAINSSLDVSHAPYLVRYEFTPGAVISIAGEVISGSPIHTFNYSGDPETSSLYTNGLLTAVTLASTKNDSAWGEAVVGSGATQTPPTVSPGGGTYDEYGGLLLGANVGFLSIDQDRPVGERFSINATVKGSIYQNVDAQYGGTIIAISDANSKYLAWVRLTNGGYLQVITYSTTNMGGLTGNTTGVGFMSKQLPSKFDNDFMNIQVSSQRSGTTHVYLNGELFSSFPSGTAVLSYGNMTIGDLRPARGLQYSGAVYNFALYSETIDQEAVGQNWNYVTQELGIK